jgi:hypothetical protein
MRSAELALKDPNLRALSPKLLFEGLTAALDVEDVMFEIGGGVEELVDRRDDGRTKGN